MKRPLPILSALAMVYLSIHTMASLLLGGSETAYERSERLREESCSKSIYEVGGGCIYDGGYVDWSVRDPGSSASAPHSVESLLKGARDAH